MSEKENRPKILIHCQYVYGLGHFVRSIELAKALSKHFEVYLLNGGEAVLQFILPPRIHLIQLAAIFKNETENFLRSVDPSQSLEACFVQREILITRTIHSLRPDIFLSEHFPFGLLFEKEVLRLIKNVKNQNPDAKIVCSVRDIIESATGGEHDAKTCSLLNEHYNLLLVHGDEKFAPLNLSFPLFDEINIPTLHTGYVARAVPEPGHLDEIPLILASVAGGRLGNELIEALIKSAPRIAQEKDHRMVLFCGAFQQDRKGLESLIVASGANVSLLGFDGEAYLKCLAEAKLVITLGGYNSVIESISAGKNLLVYNRKFAKGNLEQDLRIKLFEQSDLLAILSPESLKENTLAEIILARLGKRPLTDNLLNVEGAENACIALIDLLNTQ